MGVFDQARLVRALREIAALEVVEPQPATEESLAAAYAFALGQARGTAKAALILAGEREPGQ